MAKKPFIHLLLNISLAVLPVIRASLIDDGDPDTTTVVEALFDATISALKVLKDTI